MNYLYLIYIMDSGIMGIGFVLIFFFVMIISAIIVRRRGEPLLRDIPPYSKLKRSINLAVESGQRLHLSLGSGGINYMQGGSALTGLSLLKSVYRMALLSDRPPVATSGDGTTGILSRDSIRSVYEEVGVRDEYEATYGQVSGLTPGSYIAGTLPVILDQQVSTNILVGHFNSDIALMAYASERRGCLTVAGPDSITAQAVLYASCEDLLVGEELYASGAYIQPSTMHVASLHAQDFLRWAIVAVILVAGALKLAGVL
ncbi:DUF6754 domain-containing protein [Chloroflexota bacterium]